jgi:hypothetical protein
LKWSQYLFTSSRICFDGFLRHLAKLTNIILLTSHPPPPSLQGQFSYMLTE